MANQTAPDPTLAMVWKGQAEFLTSEAHITAAFMGAGAGKCVESSTITLTYDGHLVRADEVKLGDLLMGPDSAPRKVLEIHRGAEPLYEIVPVSGDNFRVTGNHLLTLSRSWPKKKGQVKGELIDVRVFDWMTWSNSQKKQWKLVRKAVDFVPPKRGPIDPYFLGLLLGDGSFIQTPNVTTMDTVIVEELERQAVKWNLRLDKRPRPDPMYKAFTYAFSGTCGKSNPLANALRSLGLWGHRGGSKFIPHEYKTASRHDRLEILAGLMDTDGSATHGSYDYISKSKQLVEDIVFVSRSLGFAAYMKECRKGCQTGAIGTYYRVCINGGNEIPARLRPQLHARKQCKDVLHTGFSVVPQTEPEPWVGFVLDGDQRFLLGDFTVTHNSHSLTERIIRDHSYHDLWWQGRAEFNTQPLILMVGAAHEAYLAENTVPLFRASLDRTEARIGRTLRKRTGRNRDGWFGSVGHRHQEMLNCTDIHFKSFPTKENAVAVSVAGLYFDEITMFSDVEIWRRSLQRVRDPRAGKRPSGNPWNFVACVGTPEEDHWIHEALIDPVTGEPYPGVHIVMGSSMQNILLPDSWFEDVGRHSSELFTRMQVMGEWVRGAGGQRFAHVFDEDRHLVQLVAPKNKAGLQFDIGWDPGYDNGSVVVMWQRPSDGAWFVVDEIAIRRQTTMAVCAELRSRGYGPQNIRSICMDPRDNKKRSTSEETDGDKVRKLMGVRPKNKHIGERSGELFVRLDALEDLMRSGKFFISDSLKPRSRQTPGLVNALHNFATKKMEEDAERFVDKPTRMTNEKWKHPIDAVHFVLMHYERGVYARVARNPTANQIG